MSNVSSPLFLPTSITTELILRIAAPGWPTRGLGRGLMGVRLDILPADPAPVSFAFSPAGCCSKFAVPTSFGGATLSLMADAGRRILSP
eukprot:4502969-Prymnesium_polylepis.2